VTDNTPKRAPSMKYVAKKTTSSSGGEDHAEDDNHVDNPEVIKEGIEVEE
jgi:hypothetical protein